MQADDQQSLSLNPRLALIFKGESPGSPDDPYVKSCKEIGIEAHVIPTLSFRFINQDQLLNCLKVPSRYSSIVFTSPRSVEAVSMVLEAVPDNTKLTEEWKRKLFFAVGKTTSEAASLKLGFQCMGQESGNADALVPYIFERLSPSEEQILFPCGNLSRETIPTLLTAQEFQVESIVVYETTANEMLEFNLKHFAETHCSFPGIMAFFSPSGVKSVLPVLKNLSLPLARLKFVSIGPTTSEALRKEGLDVYAQAAKPNPESLAEAIAKGIF